MSHNAQHLPRLEITPGPGIASVRVYETAPSSAAVDRSLALVRSLSEQLSLTLRALHVAHHIVTLHTEAAMKISAELQAELDALRSREQQYVKSVQAYKDREETIKTTLRDTIKTLQAKVDAGEANDEDTAGIIAQLQTLEADLQNPPEVDTSDDSGSGGTGSGGGTTEPPPTGETGTGDVGASSGT